MGNNINSRSRRPVDDNVNDNPYEDDDDGPPADDESSDDNGGADEGNNNDNSGDGGDGEPVGKSLGGVATTVGDDAAFAFTAEDFVLGVTEQVGKSLGVTVDKAIQKGLQSDVIRDVIREELHRYLKPVHTLVKGIDSRQETYLEHVDDRLDYLRDEQEKVAKSLGDFGETSLAKSLSTLRESAEATIEAAKHTPENKLPASAPAASAGSESTLVKGGIGGSAAEAIVPPTASQQQEIGQLIQKGLSLQDTLGKSVPGLGNMIDLRSGGHPIGGDDVEKLRAGIASVEAQ